MIRKFSVVPFLATLLVMMLSCSDMNDKHDIYLSMGEEIYIGKVDSVHVLPGNKRVKVRFWASDPRCKSVGFFWSPYNDSVFVNINKTSSVDSFEVVIGGVNSEKIIAEGNYTFKIFTYDNKGHRSVPYEKIVKVYGSRYESSLSNRVLTSRLYSSATGTLSLYFGLPINEDDIGVAISYFDNNGVQNDSILVNGQITAPVVISNIDATKEVSYKTLYLPDPLAIDTFHAVPRTIQLQ
jgi:hypothetical protein